MPSRRARGCRAFPIPLVSELTLIASREKDRNGFVLGPVTLGLGAMLSLLLYPLPAASLAIYALAFGDGIASLAGTIVRGPRIPLFGGKTISGSLACFVAVFVVTLGVTQRPVEAFILAARRRPSRGHSRGELRQHHPAGRRRPDRLPAPASPDSSHRERPQAENRARGLHDDAGRQRRGLERRRTGAPCEATRSDEADGQPDEPRAPSREGCGGAP